MYIPSKSSDAKAYGDFQGRIFAADVLISVHGDRVDSASKNSQQRQQAPRRIPAGGSCLWHERVR